MQNALEITSHVSTPLALAGILCAFFFFILKQIFHGRLIPQLPKLAAFPALKLIIDRLFFLSIIAVILGFIGYVISSLLPIATKVAETNKPNDTIVFSQQFRDLDELRKHLEGLDESELRAEFDFGEIESKNIGWQKARYAKAFYDVDYNEEKYWSVGTTAISMGEIVVNMESGASEAKARRLVPFVAITTKYSVANKTYLKLVKSPYVPESIVTPVKALMDAANENVIILGRVLESAAAEFPGRYKTARDMQKEDFWIHNRFMKEFVSLSPKADAINRAIRAYLRVESVR